jgi:hypothetical protein
MKKLIMMICAAAGLFLAAAGPVTAAPVNYYLWDNSGGTWADAEKTTVGTDDLMCWAAAASNILEWTGWGKVAGMTNTDQMFNYFQNHWTDQGGMMRYGWNWWFSGTYNGPPLGSVSRPVGSSGSVWSQPDVLGGGFYPSQNFYDYYHESWNSLTSLSTVDQYLHSGYGTTLAVYSPSLGHALTCWGFQYDADNAGYYTGIYVTDSDDRADILRFYEITKIDGIWYLENFYGTSNTWAIEGIQAMAARPVVPEPMTICLMAMGSLVFMRKKKQY